MVERAEFKRADNAGSLSLSVAPFAPRAAADLFICFDSFHWELYRTLISVEDFSFWFNTASWKPPPGNMLTAMSITMTMKPHATTQSGSPLTPLFQCSIC